MANRLSDDELRKLLKEYGENVGPITPTTRSTYEKRLYNLRKSKGSKVSLNAFSSDDSEVENSFSGTNNKSRRESTDRSDKFSASTNSVTDKNLFKRPLSGSSSSSTVLMKKSPLNKTLNFKNHHVAGKKNSSRQAAFDVETSDSDFDSDPSFGLEKNPRRTRRKSSLSSSPLPKIISRQKPLSATWNPKGQQFNLNEGKYKREHTDESYVNGCISNTLSNGALNGERIKQSTSTNYSHCISLLLLLGTATFFIIIGIVYITELQKSTNITNRSYSNFCDDLKEEDCEFLILISRELHHLLTNVAGIYDCATERENIKRNLTISEASQSVQNSFRGMDFKKDHFDLLFKKSILLLGKSPDMGIKFHFQPGIEDLSSQSIINSSHISSAISALEAERGSKSLWCRIKLSFQWTLAKVVLFLSAGFIVFLCFMFTKFLRKRKEVQEKLFYEMVEKVIDILQETPEVEPYKAVVKVRDAIIPPKERKEKLWLWDKVVTFIEENESRVTVEYHKINGEDFKVWKWQPCATENENGKQGKVWQGQAFSNLGKGKNAMYSLSPCLKIRNMFDSEVEYEDGWEVSITDAILEKCEENSGIRHIAIDTSTNEGCVYMLCSSTEMAGKAFNDLHGWWFDGKLVTVKYIPYKRYLERFPESERCTVPLRPSNNKRLSLSTPFFSSVLERS